MNSPVACITEYIDSCTHFSLICNIQGSVVKHSFVYHTGKWGMQGHFADSPCTVQSEGNKHGVTFFFSWVSVGVCLSLRLLELNQKQLSGTCIYMCD